MRLVKRFSAAATVLSLALTSAFAADQAADKRKSPSPAADQTQEERTHSHSQPLTPGSSATNASKADKSDRSASAGATAPELEQRQQAFKTLDIDGDGLVSKAEAAGNAEVTGLFDRWDRNKDGKLSVAEFDRSSKPRPEKRSASAGASAPKKKPRAD